MKVERGSLRQRAPVLYAAGWVSLLALVILYGSGWALYNEAPIFGFRWPARLTLAGWLAGAAQWHRLALWLLAQTALVCLVYAVSTPSRRTHVTRQLRRLAPQASFPSLVGLGMAGVLGLILTGIALWRVPVADGFAAWFGGERGLRVAHFVAMLAVSAALAWPGLAMALRSLHLRLADHGPERIARFMNRLRIGPKMSARQLP